MLFGTWLAYAIAAFVIIIIPPGPTILLVVTQSMAQGIKAAIPLVVGVFFGDLIAMLGSMFGLGLLIATSATLFSVVKFVGALYLVYLGISLWRVPISGDETGEVKVKEASPWHLGRQAFLVTVLNPKGIVFFLAFLPQFVNPQNTMVPQLTILGTTFLVIAVVNAGAYAVMAARMSRLFKQPSVRRKFNRIGGTALVGAGLVTAATQKV